MALKASRMRQGPRGVKAWQQVGNTAMLLRAGHREAFGQGCEVMVWEPNSVGEAKMAGERGTAAAPSD